MSKDSSSGWSLYTFKEVHELLLEVASAAPILPSTPATAHAGSALKRMQFTLLRHKQDFIHLFAEPAQDPSTRKELEKGGFP